MQSDLLAQPINVLVAEDDNFQRLALIDILTLCNYQVTAVENGRLARDELLKEDSHIDIVLLDLRMPEMDGYELLCLMQKHERLQKIPVIMMSFGDESEIVTLCLSAGAKNYLVKPLRIQNVKDLRKYVEFVPQNNQNGSTADLVGIQQYIVINNIGQGASGTVDLVQRRNDGKLFAMKTISMKFMDKKERDMVQQEIILLKVLNAPSIIRYYESFNENDEIHIVMEYAEKGALSDKIKEHKVHGIPMDENMILYFTAQLIISVWFMHSKNILHRDIKAENLFMTKENVIKLGDFGISKTLGTNNQLAKTLIGTPFNMPPEVCSGEPYGFKADIWAIGCTLYEMTNLRRPFNLDNINVNVLFSKIINEEYPPLHENVSPDIRMLITFMLQKDPSKRPSVWDLVKIPVIDKHIKYYFETEAPENEIFPIIVDPHIPYAPATPPSPSPSLPSSSYNQKEEDSKPRGLSETSKIDQKNSTNESIMKAMMEALEPYDERISLFRVEHNVINGEDIFKWLEQYYPDKKPSALIEFVIELVDKKYLHHVNGLPMQNSKSSLYRYQCFMPGQPTNSFKIYQQTARNAFVIFEEIIKQANEILSEITQTFSMEISDDLLVTNKKYLKFLEMICELQKVYLKDLNQNNQIKCFFINLCQIMQFHKYLRKKYIDKKMSTKKHSKTLLESIYGFFFDKSERFFYLLGYDEFELDDVKHGILRENKPQMDSNFKPFKKNDNRLQLVFPQDLRVLLLFKEDSIPPTELKLFSVSNLDKELDDFCAKFISKYVCIDSVENDITLNNVFKIYMKDFGGSVNDVIRWIAKYTKVITDVDQLIQEIADGETFVQFQGVQDQEI